MNLTDFESVRIIRIVNLYVFKKDVILEKQKIIRSKKNVECAK